MAQAIEDALPELHNHWSIQRNEAESLERFLGQLAGESLDRLWEHHTRGTGNDIGDIVASAVSRVLPWALGYGDPVRDRVEARRRKAAE